MKGNISIECGFDATVTDFVQKDNLLKVGFQGYSSEFGHYQGEFNAMRQPQGNYRGAGNIRYTADNEIVYARVALEPIERNDKDELTLAGVWQDSGDPENYAIELNIEGCREHPTPRNKSCESLALATAKASDANDRGK